MLQQWKNKNNINNSHYLRIREIVQFLDFLVGFTFLILLNLFLDERIVSIHKLEIDRLSRLLERKFLIEFLLP